MSISDLLTWSKVLLAKVSAITGWGLPQDNRLLTVLVDQFAKKMMEEYRRMNSEEIEYAFRTYASRVENYGSELSIVLIDKVLHEYIMERWKVSKIEETIPVIEYKAETTTEEFLQSVYSWYKLKGFIAIPSIAYDVMEREGILKLTSEQKHQVMGEMKEAYNITDRYLAKSYAVKKFFDANESRFAAVKEGDRGQIAPPEAGQ